MGLIVVIGYGNTLRSDDGAGVKLAERLAIAWRAQDHAVRLLTARQLVPELAHEIASGSIAAVVFVDATVGSLDDPIRVRRLDVQDASPALGHHLAPTALLAYAELLHGHTVPAWLVTVPGVDFDHGEQFSPAVQRLLCNAPSVADQLALEIRTHVLCTN